jgi:hypothetical protein
MWTRHRIELEKLAAIGKVETLFRKPEVAGKMIRMLQAPETAFARGSEGVREALSYLFGEAPQYAHRELIRRIVMPYAARAAHGIEPARQTAHLWEIAAHLRNIIGPRGEAAMTRAYQRYLKHYQSLRRFSEGLYRGLGI